MAPGPFDSLDLGDASFQAFFDTLSPEEQKKVNDHSEHLWCYSGKTLIKQNEDPDNVYIIEDGVVEVLIETHDAKTTPPITYLGKGDIIGELGVMNQNVRSATIRAAADVYYRKIVAGHFFMLMHSVPGFASYIAFRLAHRLANTTHNVAFNSICMDLSGKLPNFDLISVFYTVATSGATGEIRIVDEHKERLGNFFFREGRILHARFRHLQGMEACWQLFMEEKLKGAFSFRRGETPSRPAESGFELDEPVDDILMRGAVLRDNFSSAPTHYKDLVGSLERAVDSLDGLDLEYPEEGKRIFEICERQDLGLGQVWSCSGLSQVTFIQACDDLIENKAVIYKK
ncbi:MAG: cyclic nucleotide-binding domain-containing protein [Verrucomicrobiota bacterium]